MKLLTLGVPLPPLNPPRSPPPPRGCMMITRISKINNHYSLVPTLKPPPRPPAANPPLEPPLEPRSPPRPPLVGVNPDKKSCRLVKYTLQTQLITRSLNYSTSAKERSKTEGLTSLYFNSFIKKYIFYRECRMEFNIFLEFRRFLD